MATQVTFLPKIRFVYAVMFLMAAVLGLFSIRWQVVEAERFASAASDRFRTAYIPSIRGSIYAADGTTLAYSEPRYEVYLWIPEIQFRESKNIQTRQEFTQKLAPIIDKTGEQLNDEINKAFDSGQLYLKVADAITVEQRSALLQLTVDADKDLPVENRRRITGYELKETARRLYPENELAAQVLGLTNQLEDGTTVGLGGLEGEWRELEPLKGVISGERDAQGNAIALSAEKTVEAQRGNSIYTTIDKRLQKMVEDRLKWGVENFAAASGSIVIMDPKTGEVKAMANYPTYNPNLREAKDPSVFGNKTVSEPYEIGSVGKIFTLASALDMQAVTPDSVIIQGHQGCERIHEDLEPVCTHDKLPQPAMPIKQAFELSDNIYFLHLAQLMDKQKFHDYLVNFGIGSASGIDLQGESAGFPINDVEKWNIADQAAYSYGHSYQMNLLQATNAVGAIANYGVLMQPHVVRKVERVDGTVTELSPRAVRQVVKRETALNMDAIMHQVYQNNIFWWEGHYNDLRRYNIAMKSGTALIPLKNGLGYSSEINATYAGYDASPDRTFVMLVRLDRPQGRLASTNARILWLETFRDFKDYLGVKRIGES